jgi:nitronate monooxygenase
MIGVGGASSAAWLAGECAVAADAQRPFGVGLMAWVLDDDASTLQTTLKVGPAIVSVGFGDYAKYVGPLRAADVVVATQVGNLAEAIAAEQAGVDVVVARGGEAGGHGRNEVGTLVLLQEVLDAVSLPVLAAGGIANARGLAAVLAAGACGAWVGTAFLASAETETSPQARERLIAARDTDTVYGRVFDVGQRLRWPAEFGGRSLGNEFFDRWAGREDELARDDEAVGRLTAAKANRNFDTAYIYSGQGVGLLHEEQAAADVLAEFAAADALLAAAARLVSGS